jgi:hypothetical protein
MFKRLFPPFVALMLISCAASDLPTRKVPAAHAPTAMPSPALRRCEIKVTQNGQVIDGSLNGPIRFYALRGAPFRIDVVPSECDPSIGVFLKVDDFKFVAENPVVVTTAGFGMAGDLVDRDVLFTRAEDPRSHLNLPTITTAFKEITRAFALSWPAALPKFGPSVPTGTSRPMEKVKSGHSPSSIALHMIGCSLVSKAICR